MRRYTMMLIAPVFAAAGLGLAVAAWLQPLSGDLTRLGWWPERRFGWNGVEEHFDPPLARPGRLDRGADILVLGDSFSSRQPLSQTPAGGYWPNWLARDTGLTVAVLDSYRVTLEELVAALPRMRPTPVAVVLQDAERYVPQRHGAADGGCDAGADGVPRPQSIQPSSARPIVQRRATALPLADPPIGYGLQYLWRSGLLALGAAPPTEVAMVSLNRGALFSSRDDRSMLLHRDELRLVPAADPAWRRAGCALLTWQGRVQAAVPTVFLTVLAPDRLTAYANVLAERTTERPNGTAVLAADPRLHLARLDQAFQAAVAAGEVDLYLPNDTHWSSRGHALAARTVREDLQRRGVLTPRLKPN